MHEKPPVSRPPSWWVGVGALASWLSSFDGGWRGVGGGMLSGSGAVRPGGPAVWAHTVPAGFVACGCVGVGGVGGLVVNCIVDASIFDLCAHTRVFVVCVVLFVFLSVRWMPWHQGPMKDVVACDKPRGAG